MAGSTHRSTPSRHPVNRQILERIEGLEQRILDLEKNIIARLDGGGSPAA